MFAGAIFAGLLLSGLYIGYAITRAWINPSIAPKPPAEDIPPRSEILKEVLVSIVHLFGLIMLVLGTILAGIVEKLFFAIRLAAHRLPASMAVAALITCTLFSTATGIIGAVVTLMRLLA